MQTKFESEADLIGPSVTFRFVKLPGFDSRYAKSLIREMAVIDELRILCPPSSVFEIGEDDTLVLEGRGNRGRSAHPAWRVRVSSESGSFRYEGEDYTCPGGDCGHDNPASMWETR